MLDSVIDAARQPFLDLAADIHGSLVYLDAGAAEVAELTLGPAFLLGLGALNVCSLEHATPDDGLLPLLSLGGQPVQSLVVFTTQLLPETHQHVMHLLMLHPHVRRCQLFCSVSELAHAQLSTELCDLGVEAYREYVGELRQALAAARAAAGLPMPREDALQLSVKHLPMHIAALDTHTFVLPAASAPASKAVVGGGAAGFAAAEALAADDEGDEGALGAATGISLLSHALADLSRVLGQKLEPFALGPASTAIAKELATLPQGGSSSSAARAGLDSSSDSPRADMLSGAAGGGGSSSGGIGLVLVDRSLDLATPCMHSEHVLDLVLSCLEAGSSSGAAVGAQQHVGAAAAAPGSVKLRPVDVRLDVAWLAPLHPLPPPPPATPPLQDPMPSSSSPDPDASSQRPQTATTSRASDGGGGGVDGASADSNNNSNSKQAEADQPPASSSQVAQPFPPLWHSAGAGSSSSSGGRMGLCLFHPEDRRWLGWLSQLWPKPHKDVLLLLRKWLKEALRAEKITPGRSRLTAVVSAAELRSLAGYLMNTPDVFMRHQPIIGLALAAAAAISTDIPPTPTPAPAAGGGSSSTTTSSTTSVPPVPVATLWERLAGYERQLLLTLPDGTQGREMLVAMLLEAVQAAHPQQHRLQLSGVVELLLVTYSLCGDRTPPASPLYSGDESQIRDALADVILAHAATSAAAAAVGEGEGQAAGEQQGLATLAVQLQCLPNIQRLMLEAVQSGALQQDPSAVRAYLSAQLLEVWGRLRWCASARGKLRDVRRLMEVEADTGAASSTRPLLRQVLGKILLQAENRDLKQVESSSLVAGLLTKGLGRLGFGGITAPVRRVRIDDYSTVLLFVIGGLSPAEVRHVQSELEQHVYGHKPRVLLGGTTLLSPGEAARLFLG